MGMHSDDAIADAIDSMIIKQQHEDMIAKWNDNIHIDENLREKPFKELSIHHIKNIIKYFEIYNTEHPLYNELHKRGIYWKIIK